MSTIRKLQNRFNNLPGSVYLWLAVFIFGGAGVVTRRLTELGEANFIDGENPISFCNVLFVGNLCALLVLSIAYRQQVRLSFWRRLRLSNWTTLLAVGILSGAISPGFSFEALSRTEVTNVILVSRIEPPLVLGLSVLILHERVNGWQILGAAVSFAGVVTIVLLQGMTGEMFDQQGLTGVGLGEIFAAVGAIALGVSTIISKMGLSQIANSIYAITRTAIGTVFFFVAAIIIYGWDHFAGVLSPFLWQWMLLYGAIVVALGQSFWFKGLESVSSSKVSLASSVSPIIGIAAAWIILNEVPSTAQWIGGMIVICGIFLGQIGVSRLHSRQTTKLIPVLDNQIGFKGI